MASRKLVFDLQKNFRNRRLMSKSLADIAEFLDFGGVTVESVTRDRFGKLIYMFISLAVA